MPSPYSRHHVKRAYSTKPVGPSPKASSKSISTVMKSNRRSGTTPELTLVRLLRRKLVSNNLPGNPDIAYSREKVAVFVNGCFWHRCPICDLGLPKTNTEFWKRKFARNVERDRLNKEELEAIGWRVLVIWEHQLKEDPRRCARRVKASLGRL